MARQTFHRQLIEILTGGEQRDAGDRAQQLQLQRGAHNREVHSCPRQSRQASLSEARSDRIGELGSTAWLREGQIAQQSTAHERQLNQTRTQGYNVGKRATLNEQST
jgi:hypothetical protein